MLCFNFFFLLSIKKSGIFSDILREQHFNRIAGTCCHPRHGIWKKLMLSTSSPVLRGSDV